MHGGGSSTLVLEAPFETSGTLQVVDLDGDGMPEIIASGVALDGRSSVLIEDPDASGDWIVDVDHPLSSITAVNCMLFGDVDSDGRVDAYVCRNGRDQLLVQTEDGSWRPVTGLPVPSSDLKFLSLSDPILS